MPRQRKFRVWCENEKKYETHYTLIAENGVIFQQEKNGSIKPTGVTSHIIEDYVEILDAYEGDYLYGSSMEGGYESPYLESWIGEVKWNEEFGRIMVWIHSEEEWRECDDFDFEKVIGNIHENNEQEVLEEPWFPVLKMEDFFND